MVSFQNIEFLYGLAALIPLVGLFICVIRWKQKTRKLLGNERLVSQLISNYSSNKYFIKAVSILVAIALLIISAANLRKPIKEKGTVGSGIDVMIALDVSKSMLAEDEKPTRLDKAKQLIYQLTQQLENNRIGLVVFAGRAYLQMPLTSDVGATKMFVNNANPALISWQGTVIGDALTLCSNSLDTKEKKYKAAILITDGEDQDTKAVEVAKELAEKGVIVHTVGVGSESGAPIIEAGTNEYKRDANGETVITKLNSKLLRQIADVTGGTYHYLNTTESVGNDLSQLLNAMDKKEFGNPSGYINYDSYYFIFLAIAIFLLIIEFFVSERKKNKMTNQAAVFAVCLLFITVPVLSQTNTSVILKGNDLYKKGDFKAAQTEYEKVLDKDSKNNAAAFNDANRLYRQQQYAETSNRSEALSNISSDPILQAKAWYNKGVAEVKQKQMEQAAASFKKSLLLNNNDETARENLQMVLNQLNEKNKKQDNQQSEKNKPQPKDNKQPSKKQAEQQLNMLREEEKRLQKEIQQKKFKQESGEEKDW